MCNVIMMVYGMTIAAQHSIAYYKCHYYGMLVLRGTLDLVSYT